MSRTPNTLPDFLPDSLDQDKDSADPQLDSQPDGTSIPLDGSDESSTGVPGDTADEVLTDGRISGLPPSYDREVSEEAPFDSPAMDAELQREEAQEGASK